jgi:hypothetical protein
MLMKKMMKLESDADVELDCRCTGERNWKEDSCSAGSV